MNLYTHNDVISLIHAEISRLGNQKALSEVAHVSPSYLSDILAGKRNPNPGILKYLGLKVQLMYAKVEERTP